MTWYAAHVIVSVRPVKPRKGDIDVYENVFLIEASNEDEATDKARKFAEASVVKDDTLTVDGEPAALSFVGIRKVISVSNPWPLNQDGDRPVDGSEITYSLFRLKDEQALTKLVSAKEVVIHYIE
jgi:uncharacterized protein DUF4288